MAGACQLSALAAGTMVVLVLAAAIATLTSVIIAYEPPTPGQNCYRRCVPGDYKVCHFKFDVQPYQTMARACYDCPHNVTDCYRPDCVAGDGVTRRILVVNKQLPGPPIQVCYGDTVVVDVKNSLNAEGITVHWHGLTMRGSPSPSGQPSSKGTPYMDGVPGVTQCPIPSGASFRYTFLASDAGTHFYHAHSGFHRGDGVFGALIVRQPLAEDPNHNIYDYDLPEHVIVLHDWLHIPSEDKFLFRHHSGGDDFPKSMLVNGRGPYQFAVPGSPQSLMPYSRFKVTAGNRYRLRLISTGILNCPIVFRVEDHLLTIIASDGSPLYPVNATSLVLYSGERWDVVLQADQSKSGFFWMSFMGGVDCEVTEAHQFALLQYEELGGYLTKGGISPRGNTHDLTLQRTLGRKPKYSIVPPPGLQVNTINRACTNNLLCVASLRAHLPMPKEARVPKADFTYYLAFEMNRINNVLYYSRTYYNFDLLSEEQQIPSPQVNNLSFVHPATPLILGGGSEGNLCNAESPPIGRNCHVDHCECVHLYTIPLGAVVDLVFIDEGKYGDENHPIHLHGEYFWVLAQDRPNDVPDASITRSEVMELDRRGKIVRNLRNPPLKDTVTIADGGYSVVRFHATNPGYWLMHCHLLFHSEAGMDVVFKIGQDHDIPPPPPGLPTCGNFKGSDF